MKTLTWSPYFEPLADGAPSELMGDFSSKENTPNANTMFVSKSKKSAKVFGEPLTFSPKPLFTEMGKLIAQNHANPNVRFRRCKPGRELQAKAAYDPKRQARTLLTKTEVVSGSSVSLEGKFAARQDIVIEMLRTRLLKNRLFSINELHKTKNLKKPLGEESLSKELMAKFDMLLRSSDKAEFIKLCNEDRQVSRTLQIYIETCDTEHLTPVLSRLEQSIPDLVYHPLGNYALQIAVKRSPSMAGVLEEYCSHHLLELLNDEFASRVMQTIGEISSSFRKKILDWAGNNLGLLMETLPSVFALTAAISSAQSPEEFACIRNEILSQSARQYMKKRYFKRILMSFLEKCELEDIDRVCKAYLVEKQFLAYLNDKFGAFIVVAIVRRGHQNMIALLLRHLQQNIIDLYGTKFFKFVFFRLIRDTDLGSQMLESLVSMKPQHQKAAMESRSACLFFCYLIVATLAPTHSNILMEIEKAISSYDKLRVLLLRLPANIQK